MEYCSNVKRGYCRCSLDEKRDMQSVNHQIEELKKAGVPEENIEYESQKTFEYCKDKKALPFDFYIPSFNLLMEYQGEQHYIPIPRSNMTDKEANENLVKIQNHDKIKRKYCEDNNINLIEIPYWENEDLENYLFDKFLDLNLIIEIKTSA